MNKIIDIGGPKVVICKLITGETIIGQKLGGTDNTTKLGFPSIIMAADKRLGFQPYLQFISSVEYIETLTFKDEHIMFSNKPDGGVRESYLEFVTHVKQQISPIQIVPPGKVDLKPVNPPTKR